ncbi:hypothetical protein BDN72DRAFT_902264 [Pluteus cervinus]|uniref:Uncharacterized protein n=1 Tax=Pluteus cervinus TaxID=181527 RepID=A0ACD3AD02_9AGAR|nr:hypothetical protein BDN72DRAFT_902264 [Pluteus cervinus]
MLGKVNEDGVSSFGMGGMNLNGDGATEIDDDHTSGRNDGHGEGLADVAIEDEANRLTPFDQIDHFEGASRAVHMWLAEWGGLDTWPQFLDDRYRASQASGLVDQWVRSVVDHADRGRLLERLLGQMETTLPQEMWRIRELWRQQTRILGLVVKALTLIEVRVDLIQRGPFNLFDRSG